MIYILCFTSHIGDSFETQKVMQNIIHCNQDKNILLYIPNNFFIHSAISNNLLYDNKELISLIDQMYNHPYLMYLPLTTPDKTNLILIEMNMTKLLNNGIHISEMNPESYQTGIIEYFDKLRKFEIIDFKYTVLENKDLIPEIPATNIDLFLEWRKLIKNPLIFYYNYFPKSGQLIPCMTDYEHEQVIIHIAKINPHYIILVPKYTKGIKDIPNIVSCEKSFNCKETITCENIYKQLKIQDFCNYSITYEIGACFIYMNKDAFLKKNTILQFTTNNNDSYYKLITDFFKSINPNIDKIHSIICHNYNEMLNYFDTPLTSEWKQIQRKQGYGASFNNLYLRHAMIKKEAKNDYGIKKIQKEIIFYKFVQEHKCCAMPEFIESTDTSYIMKYLPTHTPLFKVFPFFTETKKTHILQKINSHLQRLHETEVKFVLKEHYQKALQIEMLEKLEKRYEEVKEILSEYAFIKTVNNIPIRTFQENLGRLQQALNEFIKTQIYFKFNPIHGDCQFNNILYNEETDDLVFIDPRGYFGDNDLYGLAEYDFAKVLFALSGYDVFDAREVTGLDISGSNVMLEIPTLVPEPLAQTKNRFLSQVVVSIWMGNAHCFKENKFKTAYSYFIAMYYASLYL